MKVVGTKLDDSDYERFETLCIDKGISKSEIMRGLIKQYCDDCEHRSDVNDSIIMQDSEVKSTPEAKIKRISYDGKNWIDISELNNVVVSD